MSIQALWIKFKGFLGREDILLSLLIIFVATTSFVLGRHSVVGERSNRTETRAIHDAQALSSLQREGNEEILGNNVKPAQTEENGQGAYVASKNGTKYHLPWCSGAKNIKEENKVWFATKTEAEAAGYTPAANCKGI